MEMRKSLSQNLEVHGSRSNDLDRDGRVKGVWKCIGTSKCSRASRSLDRGVDAAIRGFGIGSNFTLAHLKEKRPYIILGAGASGLFAGYFLKQKNIPFEIWEPSDSPGGKLQSHRNAFGLIEKAANGILQDELVTQLCHDIKLPVQSCRPKLGRTILDLGEFHSRPSLKSMFELLWKSKNMISVDLSHQSSASLSELMRPWLGNLRSTQFLSAMTRGIYGTSANELHGLSVLPELLSQETMSYFSFLKNYKRKMKGMKTISFEGGMQTLVDFLADYLKPSLILKKETNSSDDIDWEKNIIFACPPAKSADLLEGQNSTIASALRSIHFRPLASTTFFTTLPIIRLQQTFGTLITPRTSEFIYGILSNSEIFEKRVHQPAKHSYTIIHSPVISWDEIISFLQKYFLLQSTSIIYHESISWNEAIPKYDTSLFQAVQHIHSELNFNSKLNFNGAFIGPWIQIGLKDILHQAHHISLLAS